MNKNSFKKSYGLLYEAYLGKKCSDLICSRIKLLPQIRQKAIVFLQNQDADEEKVEENYVFSSC